MEKSLVSGKPLGNVWFVVLFSFVLCFVLLCFDYSALTGNDTDYEPNIFSGKSFENPIAARDSISRDSSKNSSFSRLSDDSLNDSCSGRYIYAHRLPSRFNEELVETCNLITRGTDKNMCPYLENLGLGPETQDTENVLLNRSWFTTNQFMLEVIFHNKMKRYDCLTGNSSLASAIYVPFYAGLDMSKYLWGYNISVRDSSAYELLNWLRNQKEWTRMWGRDHFLVAGRISWDFRRQTDNESDWGSKLRFLPESQNMSMLSIESSSWSNDYAIPYPTCFHPSSDEEILQWQERMRVQEREYLFAFAGAPRPEYHYSIRGKIIDQCLESGTQCKLLDCNYGVVNCDNPVSVMRVFRNTVFCLQPPGDSYTRRSIFDSILAGCIPVFFHPGTAYAQYKWHLPKNYTIYSVYIPVKDINDWNISLNETLLQIPIERVVRLREEVIKLIPRLVYADPRYRLESNKDAFDLAVDGILAKFDHLRRLIEEGKDPGVGFADADDYKYTFSAYQVEDLI